jgi:hypothetical protein
VHQRVLINPFQKPNAKRIQNLKSAANNSLGDSPNPVLICVHLCASVVEIPYGASRLTALAASRPLRQPLVNIQPTMRPSEQASAP